MHRTRARRGVAQAVIGLVGLLAASGTPAQEAWEFRLTPYVWAPSFEVTTGLPDGGEGSNSGSVLDYLAGAFLITGEARRDRLSFFGDYNYINLSDGLDPPASRLFDRVRLEGWFGTIAAGYAVHETQTTRIEPFAGVRHWSLTTRLEGRPEEPEFEKSLTDALIGVRAEHALNDDWGLRGTLDFGGFGIDGSSELQIEAIAAASYAFSERISGILGYRHLQIDLGQDTPPTISDVTFSGPFIALDFRF